MIRGLLDSPVQLLVFKLIIPLVIAWLVPAKLLLPALMLLLVVICLNLAQLSFLLGGVPEVVEIPSHILILLAPLFKSPVLPIPWVPCVPQADSTVL